nr:MAG TPA: hypothetical protein [Caudoviricetes sp.]
MPLPPEVFRSRTTHDGQTIRCLPSKPCEGLPSSHPLSFSPEGQVKHKCAIAHCQHQNELRLIFRSFA